MQRGAVQLLLEERHRRDRLQAKTKQTAVSQSLAADAGALTHPSLADAQRLRAPLVADRALQRAEPRVREVAQPPVRRVVHRDLSPHARTQRTNSSAHPAQGHRACLPAARTLRLFGLASAANDARTCAHSARAIVSRSWSGTMRSDTCARTVPGITVGSAMHKTPRQRRARAPAERLTARAGPLDVMDRERRLAPARRERRRRRLRDRLEALEQLPLLRVLRAHAVVWPRAAQTEVSSARRRGGFVRHAQKPGTRTVLSRPISVESSWTLRARARARQPPSATRR